MTTWAKEKDGSLQYAREEEFMGIPNWRTHEAACRARGYMPLEGEAEIREGYTAAPATWHTVSQTIMKIEPRQKTVPVYEEDPETHEQVQVGERTIMEDKEITFDKSYIQIDTWDYTQIPVYPPDPEPSTTERDTAEKAIVGAILALARKYDAVEDLVAIEDITIPNLKALADSKGVPEEEFGALITMLTPYKWQLEAVNGQLWADCWDGLKSRFSHWIEELNQAQS